MLQKCVPFEIVQTIKQPMWELEVPRHYAQTAWLNTLTIRLGDEPIIPELNHVYFTCFFNQTSNGLATDPMVTTA